MAEACYRPRYAPAAFKGVAFEATEADSEHGRRGAEGEFPFGEHTAYADLGRRIRHYKLKARFVKNTHVADAGRLIRACESPGPGILVHPTRGAVRAACKSIKVHDNLIDSMGLTTADLEFVEANDWLSGAGLGGSLFGLNLGPVVAAVETFFTARYQPDTVPFFAVPAATAVARDGAQVIATALTETVGITTERSVWEIGADLRDFAASSARALDPSDTWTVVAGGVAAIDRYGGASSRPEVLRAIANWAATRATTGPASVVADAFVTATRIVAAVTLARSLMDAPQGTLSDGLAHHDRITAMLMQEASIARARCDHGLFMELQTFATDARRVLLSRAYNLPAVTRYDFGGGVHALAAAWEIYGDARRSRDVERYNPSQWPWALGNEITAVAAA
jgi:prophage DNA circulation protein